MKPNITNHFCLILSILVSIVVVNGQERDSYEKRFDSVFYDTAVRLTAVDVGRAEKVADSLFRASEGSIYKLKSLMLKADILERQVKREEAIKCALEAEKLAGYIGNYTWMARINGFLATQYRIVGLTDLGKEFLDKGVENAKMIDDQDASKLCLGMVYQEKAHYAINEENYQESIELLEEANKLFEVQQNVNSKNLFIGINSVMIGRSFINLKQYDSAYYYCDKSLKSFNDIKIKDSQWVGQAYQGKGRVMLEQKDYDKARSFLMKSLKIAEASNYKALLEVVYEDLSRLFKEIGDQENYNLYHKKYLEEIEQIAKGNRIAVNSEVNRIFENHEAHYSQLQKVVFGLVILLLILMIFVFIIRRKQKKAYKRLVNVSQASHQTEAVLNRKDSGSRKLSSGIDNRSERIMSEEAEMHILEKLEEFEQQNGFIDSELTLSKLAVNFSVNTKYLSWVINEHKKKDFNNYINQLRVLYIVDKIQGNREYLNYKISYLSSECGFSSHSKFTFFFKQEMGITPSVFIARLQE